MKIELIEFFILESFGIVLGQLGIIGYFLCLFIVPLCLLNHSFFVYIFEAYFDKNYNRQTEDNNIGMLDKFALIFGIGVEKLIVRVATLYFFILLKMFGSLYFLNGIEKVSKLFMSSFQLFNYFTSTARL